MEEKIFIVSLGCDKNLVDSEVMLGLIKENNYKLTNEEEDADIIIVNTCSFIHDAKEESVETILEMAEYKTNGNCRKLIVTGCLTQRYKEEFIKEIPEVDAVLGATNYDEIIEAIKKDKYVSFKDINHSPKPYINRVTTTVSQYAYLKISEGCNNNCTYCIIPKLRGKLRSRDIESLVEEAKYLAKQGKQELILVAQDLGKYGVDLYGEYRLTELLKKLCEIEEIKWIRLLYCYPEDITDELIDIMVKEDKILKYIDIPLQHINNNILKLMGRKSSKEKIISTINKLRAKVDDICIRTSLIVGFPSETNEEFEELEEFLKGYKLDRVGVFTYSMEEDTKAAEMDNQIDEDIKIERQEKLMSLQQKISLENNKKEIGRIFDILIEGYIPDEGVYVGRSYKDAPNVDGMVFIESNYELLSGQMVKVRIKEVNEYDLIGEIEDEFSK